jgi:hypothetical protein
MSESALAELSTPNEPAEEVKPEQQPEPVQVPASQDSDPFLSQVLTGKLPEPKKPEAKQPEPQPEVQLKGKARENFERLEKAKKEQEERANKLQSEHEALQTKLKEYEEKLSRQTQFDPTEFTKKEQEYQQRLQQLTSELQAVSLERDPEFIARYEQPRQQLTGLLKEMATSAGIEEKEFQRALNDPDKLFEIRDSLSQRDQVRWDAAVLNIEQVNIQRNLALQNKEQTYQQLQQQRENEWKTQRQRQLDQNLALSEQVLQGITEQAAWLKEDPDTQTIVRNTLRGLAGGEGAEQWTAQEIMKHVAASKLQTPILQKQHAIIESQTSEIEELKKKLSEHEEFIKKQYGSLPSTTPSNDGEKKPEKPRAIWEEADEAVRGGRRAGFI